jgi:hypothetical protein
LRQSNHKRARYRRRGKRKESIREALKIWDKLKHKQLPQDEGGLTVPSVIIPLIRKFVPKSIAADIVGVQPMQMPTGYEDKINVRYSDGIKTKKEQAAERKAQRKAKKAGSRPSKRQARAVARMEEIIDREVARKKHSVEHGL